MVVDSILEKRHRIAKLKVSTLSRDTSRISKLAGKFVCKFDHGWDVPKPRLLCFFIRFKVAYPTIVIDMAVFFPYRRRR